MATLQTYLTATQRLLHDANFKYWTQPTLIDAINGACKRVVGDSGCNRLLQSVPLVPGRETYTYGSVVSVTVTAGGSGYNTQPFQVLFENPPAGGVTATGVGVLNGGAIASITITNPGSGYVDPPTVFINGGGGGGTGAAATSGILSANTLDVMNITVFWGSEQYILGRRSFTEFQAGIRSWTGFTNRPLLCASYGQSQWFIGPIPDQIYQSQWDSIIVPDDLVNVTDQSVITYPYSECVAYYAAHTAKFQEQSYDEADRFLQLYTQKMRYSLRSVMLRQLANAYGA